MSEYVRKQALLDRINTIRNAHIEKRNEGDECDQFANEAVADWLWAIQEEIQSGAFDADDLIGDWIGERCPKCGADMLANKVGDKWCSLVGCDYSINAPEGDENE